MSARAIVRAQAKPRHQPANFLLHQIPTRFRSASPLRLPARRAHQPHAAPCRLRDTHVRQLHELFGAAIRAYDNVREYVLPFLVRTTAPWSAANHMAYEMSPFSNSGRAL